MCYEAKNLASDCDNPASLEIQPWRQVSTSKLLRKEDGVENPRPESAYKIFAPMQLVTTELGEEETQQVHHAYDKQPSSGVLAFSAIMGESPTEFAVDRSDSVAGTPELRS